MMRAACVMMVLLAASAAALGEAAPAAKPGDVVLTLTFEGADALAGWPHSGNLSLDAGYESSQSLCIARPDGGSASVIAGRPLPLERVRGCKLVLSAMVKAEGVSARPQPWNGIKFMMPMTAGGNKSYPQAAIDVGTFGWRRVVWQAYVPDDATQATLLLGLESVTGRVWFDDVKITVRRVLPPLTPQAAAGPVYTGHAPARLRGAMVSPNATEEDLRVLGKEWGANLVRWQLCGFKPRMDTGDTAAYEAMLAVHLKKLDAILPACEKYGLMVAVDLHTGPGQWAESGRGLFTSAACQKRFVEIWREIARRYKNAKAVWGYDLVNEPHESPFDPDLSDWQELAERAAKAIREIDPERTIIVEPAEGGGPGGMAQLRPIAVPNVVYSVHMYNPGSFTHQGVFGEWVKKIPYPGETEGKMWDKAALEASLKPAIDFQKAFGVQIYVGEFSAIRWAPDGSAARYLKDLIDIFESRGWDWTYHAFREWQGWSAEHGSDKADTKPAVKQTDRERLLREWYGKNEKPKW